MLSIRTEWTAPAAKGADAKKSFDIGTLSIISCRRMDCRFVDTAVCIVTSCRGIQKHRRWIFPNCMHNQGLKRYGKYGAILLPKIIRILLLINSHGIPLRVPLADDFQMQSPCAYGASGLTPAALFAILLITNQNFSNFHEMPAP